MQDVVFLVGIMLLLSILIIGLLPDPASETLISQDIFIYSVMIIPVIAAIYFIITSFRRNLYDETGMISSSIKKKMILAFVFVAVFPTLPLVLASNYLLNKTMSQLSFDKTSRALEEAKAISAEPIERLHDIVKNETDTLNFLYKANLMNPLTDSGRQALVEYAVHRNFSVEFFADVPGGDIIYIPVREPTSFFSERIKELLEYYNISAGGGVCRISIRNKSYFISSIKKQDVITVLYRSVNPEIARRMALFDTSLKDFKKVEFLGKYFKTNSSLFLFIIAIIVIGLSV
ncbi:MAG TPA: hypothetical protein PK859_15370, partial [Spirochaetota bacterium]|nr:hypothetical protein [Spirochaetota bacterium]